MKLVGITTQCIRHCSFIAVLIGDFKVDWKTAVVRTHKEIVHCKPICHSQPVLYQPGHCHFGCGVLLRTGTLFTGILEPLLTQLRAGRFIPGQPGISSLSCYLVYFVYLWSSWLIFFCVFPETMKKKIVAFVSGRLGEKRFRWAVLMLRGQEMNDILVSVIHLVLPTTAPLNSKRYQCVQPAASI